ncbi:MAG: Quinone oxidoreductase [uncultured Sphingomonas sp.]|uniref:Quinone oxidoreductase n=1 Tax=uncultured Sphingomonas sp. TaxID=158754 RepID=A0A6J4SFK0_9SPHN|nr:MAG: Quinone oxidoreductase [uncultured Sphingomonas sp.]
MLLGALHMCLDPIDLCAKCSDAGMKLVHRHGVEILFGKRRERVVGLGWEQLVEVHGGNRLTVHGPKSITCAVPSLPTDMKAVVAADGELLLVDRPVPQHGPGEVLIKVAAAGVNRADVLQRRGLYPPPPGAPDVLGLEVAGEVVAGAGHRLGQRVGALVAGGGYAQYCVAPAGTCLAVPEVLSLTQAAAMPETLFTVWVNLFERGFAADGDWVLVHGGTSGIGTMAIALGRLFGLHVIVTCGSADKCARALELGAAGAVNYRTQDFVEEVGRLTGGAGVSVVLDMVGGDYLPRNLAALADEGRHVSIAFQRGAKAEIAIADVMRRRLTLTGSTLRPRPVEFKTMVADEIARTVWPYAEGGRLKPVIDSTFPLADAAAAHARMEAGDHIGKIVLEVVAPDRAPA